MSSEDTWGEKLHIKYKRHLTILAPDTASTELKITYDKVNSSSIKT